VFVLFGEGLESIEYLITLAILVLYIYIVLYILGLIFSQCVSYSIRS